MTNSRGAKICHVRWKTIRLYPFYQNIITEVGLSTVEFEISFKMHANKFKTKYFNNKGKNTSIWDI